MKATVHTRYGSPDVLQLKEVARPVPQNNEVLVKVKATSVNRTDCATIRAKPFFMRLVTGLFRPKRQIPGTAFAGEVVAVGRHITTLKTGDRVFGFDDQGARAQAEYLAINKDKVVTIPDNINYSQAASAPEGAHYALNFINKVNLKRGDMVLVYGASGAIGSAGVQLLKHFGAEVTAVCATKNHALAKSLGADKIIDYTKEDFTKDNQKYYFVMDAVGKSSFFKCKALLQPGGIYSSSDLGFLAQNIYLPLLTPMLKLLFSNKRTIFPMPTDIMRSLLLVQKLMSQGEFKPVIDREYPLDQIAEAYRYVEKGHKTGNVVITV